jgi:hypothetical protein
VHYRLWLWPNLLSLDAPVVALLWQAFFVRAFHARLGLIPAVLLAAAVWLVYAADRMLDAWRGTGLQPRHEFYRRHWRVVLPVWGAVFGAGVWLAATRLPRDLLLPGLAIGAGTAVYFAAVHAAPRFLKLAGSPSGTKEAAVALVFALGSSLTAWSRIEVAADVVAIAVFSALCWINCVAIEDWEASRPARPAAVLAAGMVAVASVLFLREHRPLIGCAESAAALGLMLVDRCRLRVSPDAVRVLADAVLLTPVLLLPAVG